MNSQARPNQSEPDAAQPGTATRPVRVLIVDTAISFGGTLAVSRNLLTHLDPAVVEASLASACSDGFVSKKFAGGAKVALLPPRVDYVTLGNWKRAIRTTVKWRPLQRGIELAVIVAAIVANVPYMMRLAVLCKRLRIDIMHANNFTMEPLWTARLLRIPMIYHFHGYVGARLERSARNNFRHVRRFVSISNGVTESAIRAGIDARLIRTIPNFVDRPPDADPPPIPMEPTIGIFGRITHWKGQKKFLLAALQVLPQFPRLKVLIVGDASDGGPGYMSECLELARTSKFADRIEFTGRVTDVTRYYRQCTIVVHASTDPEPFGMVIIEAMAQARPLIASAFGAAPEIISDGVEGYIVDPNDTTAMASRIVKLLEDPERARTMGLAGHRRARTLYDPNFGARQFERLYSEVARAASVRGRNDRPSR